MNKPADDRARLAAMSPISLAGDEGGVFSNEKNSASKTAESRGISAPSSSERALNRLTE